MKKILFFMILSLFVVSGLSWAQSDTLPNDLGKKISTPEGLKKIIDSQDSKFVIFDLRSESAYNRGHIPTAINVPYGFISEIKNPPSKDKYIILYCYGGRTSRTAGKKNACRWLQVYFRLGWYYRMALRT